MNAREQTKPWTYWLARGAGIAAALAVVVTVLGGGLGLDGFDEILVQIIVGLGLGRVLLIYGMAVLVGSLAPSAAPGSPASAPARLLANGAAIVLPALAILVIGPAVGLERAALSWLPVVVALWFVTALCVAALSALRVRHVRSGQA